MHRFVNLRITKRHYWLIKGIYKITVGGKFYIGKTSNLYRRVNQHEIAINKSLLNYPTAYNNYSHWAKYIYENEGIQKCVVDVIQRCVSDSELHYSEMYYLKELRGHPDCLNLNWGSDIITTFKCIKDNLWDVTWENGFPLFFNPLRPDKKISAFAPLTANGRYSSKKYDELVRDTIAIRNRIKAEEENG
jgi:hypothetical protein